MDPGELLKTNNTQSLLDFSLSLFKNGNYLSLLGMMMVGHLTVRTEITTQKMFYLPLLLLRCLLPFGVFIDTILFIFIMLFSGKR